MLLKKVESVHQSKFWAIRCNQPSTATFFYTFLHAVTGDNSLHTVCLQKSARDLMYVTSIFYLFSVYV